MSAASAPPPAAGSSAEYKLLFHKNPIEKLEFVQDTSRNETVKKWTTDSADTIRAASHGQPWLMNIIFNLHIHTNGEMYMHSKAEYPAGGLGSRKVDILTKLDLSDPTSADSQNAMEHAMLCGAPISPDNWATVKGDKDKSKAALDKLIAMMNIFNTHMTKAVKATVPDIYSQINEEYDDLRPNPFSGVAAWKLISTLYAGADILRKDVLREQLRLATEATLVRAKDVPGWLGNIESIYKEYVTAAGNNSLAYSAADDVVMAKALNKLHEGRYISHAPDIKEWHKISDVAKELMDKREAKTLGAKQFRTLYTNVTKVTNNLIYGADAGMNVLDPNGPARSARLPAEIRGLSVMDSADSEVAFYAKNAASIQDYRRLTQGEGSTKAVLGDTKSLKDNGKQQLVQKADAGKKRGAADKDKSGSWTCGQCLKRNWRYISKDSTVERTNCFHCRAPKNPSTSKPAKDSKPVKEAGAMGMTAMGPRTQTHMEEIAKLVALMKKAHAQDNEIAQLKRQLAAKESSGTNLGAFAVEGHRMTGNEVEKVQETRNQLANLQGPNAKANGSSVMANRAEPRNGRYPLIKLHNGDTYEGEFLNGKRHGHGIYTWSDGTRYEGEYRDNQKHGRGIETSSDGSRHEVEYCDGVKSAKKTPCAIDLDKLTSFLVGIVVLSLTVYFGISLFYFILTTAGSVSEKMGTTLVRGAVHVLATVRLSGGAERAQHADIQLNQRYKQAEETNLNQDIQIAILRQEIKTLQTNAAALEETQISVYGKLRYLQKSYHNLQMQLDAMQGREQLVPHHAGRSSQKHR